MVPVKIASYIKEALKLVITQLRGKGKFEALLSSYVAELDELEAALWQLNEDRWIDTAEGEQLDGLGRIVKAIRAGATDDQFRLRLRARILLNRSSGTPNEILKILRLMVKSTTTLLYTAKYPASFLVTAGIDTLDDFEVTELSSTIGEATSAGVNSQLVYQTVSDATSFTFASGSSAESDSARGWGDSSNSATGGGLAGAVQAS